MLEVAKFGWFAAKFVFFDMGVDCGFDVVFGLLCV